MNKRRPELIYIVLLPLLLAAAGVLTFYTWETASRYEELGARDDVRVVHRQD